MFISFNAAAIIIITADGLDQWYQHCAQERSWCTSSHVSAETVTILKGI